jgi:hypothetical protein
MKVITEIDNNFGYEKITQLVDNIPLSEILMVKKGRSERSDATPFLTNKI